jgi:hypothetical protein
MQRARDRVSRRRIVHRAGVTLVLLLCGCGGRLGEGSGGADGGAEAATLGPDADVCDPSGVRICDPAAGCPVLDTASCPGHGCGDVSSVDAAATGDGVCWSDLQDEGSTSCAACDDGESCILRDTEYVCVPDAVCARFWSLGVTGACVYADKRAYSGAPLPPEPTSCPQGLVGQNVACGGACGSCPATDARRWIQLLRRDRATVRGSLPAYAGTSPSAREAVRLLARVRPARREVLERRCGIAIELEVLRHRRADHLEDRDPAVRRDRRQRNDLFLPASRMRRERMPWRTQRAT